MTKKEETYGDSTVAMTVYNVVCRSARNIVKPETILGTIRECAHPDLTLPRLRKVIRTMKRKGLLVSRGDALGPCDRKRRLAVNRDYDDAYIDEKGRLRGGWEGWMVRDQLSGLVPLKPMPPKANKETGVPV